MSRRIKLQRARVKARAQEEYRHAKWRHYIRRGRRLQTGSKKHQANRALRVKWAGLYTEARAERRRLDRALAKLPVTQLDDGGLAHMLREEGLRIEPYNDSAGHATIGVGHLLHHGPVTASDRQRWRNFDQADASALLARDLDRFEGTVRRVTKAAEKRGVRVTQSMFTALVSLAFNIGEGGFASSAVAKQMRAGRPREAADAILMWDNPPELRPRRERERRLFLSGLPKR